VALDERLRRELEGAGRPADPTGVYEGLIRRRERRRMVRRIQQGALAVVVVGGTIGGAFVLSSVVRPGENAPTIQQSYANGIIVYANHDPTSGGLHLYAVDAQGNDVRQLTHGESADHDPAWSPDGREIAFVREVGADKFIAVLDFDSGAIRRITAETFSAFDPAWSPDGERIVFTGYEDPFRAGGLFLVDADGSDLRRITDERFGSVGNPVWSRDSSHIAFTANLQDDPGSFDVYLIQPDGSELRNITSSPGLEQTEMPIGWLPSGNLLIAQGPSTMLGGPDEPDRSERWIDLSPTGEEIRVVFAGPATSAERRSSPSLSPDGRYVIFDTEVEGTFNVWYASLETGELTQVTRDGGESPAWQPIPVDEEVSPVPEPSESPSSTPDTTPVDRRITDIGLGLQLCDVSSVQGTFLAEYPDSTAFVGEELTSGGRCPRSFEFTGVIAIDLTGDGIADIASEPFTCQQGCGAFAAPDIDGDGTDEILAINVWVTVVGLQLFDVLPGEGVPAILPVLVEPPGDAVRGFEGYDGSGPPQFWIGGDGFGADGLRCEPLGGRRVLVSSTAQMVPPDTLDSIWEIHETTFVLESGVFRVIGSRDYTEPIGSSSFMGTTGCGADMSWP
jgi:Tol biopolymer transport system component